MQLPLYSAGPICDGLGCAVFAFPLFIAEYGWQIVGGISIIIALVRFSKIKRIDRIVGFFILAGVVVTSLGWYQRYAWLHRFDAESRTKITKLGTEVLWPTSLPDGWRLTRLVGQDYGKPPGFGYLYATFRHKDEGSEYVLHQFNTKYTSNDKHKCGYADPNEILNAPSSDMDSDVACIDFYSTPSNRMVYKRLASSSSGSTYFFRQDDLLVTLYSNADENKIKAFFARLEKIPVQDLPFIAE